MQDLEIKTQLKANNSYRISFGNNTQNFPRSAVDFNVGTHFDVVTRKCINLCNAKKKKKKTHTNKSLLYTLLKLNSQALTKLRKEINGGAFLLGSILERNGVRCIGRMDGLDENKSDEAFDDGSDRRL